MSVVASSDTLEIFDPSAAVGVTAMTGTLSIFFAEEDETPPVYYYASTLRLVQIARTDGLRSIQASRRVGSPRYETRTTNCGKQAAS